MYRGFLFLNHGKTDLVAGTAIANLPPPPYGFWTQFLGNMAGTWAVIGTTLVCCSDSPVSLRRLIVIFCLTVFAVNAKMIHALPLIVVLAILFIGGTRHSRREVLVAFLAAYFGIRTEAFVAWITLDADQFREYKNAAGAFFASNQGLYRELLLSPSWELCQTVIRTIPSRVGLAVEYIGLPLIAVSASMLTVSVGSFMHSQVANTSKTLVRAELATATAACVVVLWWCGMPEAPSRFLSVVAPLLVTAVSIALKLPKTHRFENA